MVQYGNATLLVESRAEFAARRRGLFPSCRCGARAGRANAQHCASCINALDRRSAARARRRQRKFFLRRDGRDLTGRRQFPRLQLRTAAVPAGRRFRFCASVGSPRAAILVNGASNVSSAILPTYARADLAFERGEGAWLTATNGERYLDFGGGIAVACARLFASPSRRDADEQGAQALAHVQPVPDPEGERLARRLAEATFADLVFFTNSGAEALKLAIKMARKCQFVRTAIPSASASSPSRARSTAARWRRIAAGGNAKYLEGFGPKVDGFDQVALQRSRGGRGGDRPGDRRRSWSSRSRARAACALCRRRFCAACARSATSTGCC